MKKMLPYPKITTKTNITFTHTQTQNININSPKGLPFPVSNKLSANKMFKAVTINVDSSSNNLSRSKSKPNNEQIASRNINSSDKSKSKILSQKGSKSSAELNLKRQSSTPNLNIVNNIDCQQSIKMIQKINGIQIKSQNIQEIKKLQDKLKLLEKKIDVIKSSVSKRKTQLSSSKRNKSKVKDNNSLTTIQSKHAVEKFQKKKEQSKKNLNVSNKILKKSYSDKNILKVHPSKIPNNIYDRSQVDKNKGSNDKKKKKENQQEVIHKFVTQVQKNPKMIQKHHLQSQNIAQKIFYYVTNLSLSLKNSDLMIYRQHLIQSLQTFSFMQKVRKPSLKELEKHSVNLVAAKKHKYTIVLDLDETLIHCNESIDSPYDVSLKIKFPTGQKIDAGVNVRPHAFKLLKQLSQLCEVIVFTASHECYANVVLDHLDPKKQFISHRLFRNHCWQTEEGIYIKDLRILKNRDLQNVLLVDNAAYSYFYQLQNGIPIIPFYDDKEDEQLLYLIKYVKMMIKMKQSHKIHNSIKKANSNYFKLSEYMRFNDLQKLTKALYETSAKEYELYYD